MVSASRASITASCVTLQNRAIFFFRSLYKRFFGTAYQHIRHQAVLAHHLYRVLSRLGLQFFRRFQIRYQRQVYHQAVLVAHLPFQLTDSLDVWKRLDITHGTTQLSNNYIIFIVFAEQEYMRRLISSVICGITWTVLPR
jgi:hypothetical protein